jgi:hypothetical protein
MKRSFSQSRFLNFQLARDSDTGIAFNSAGLTEEKFWNSIGKSSRNFAREMGSCNPT